MSGLASQSQSLTAQGVLDVNKEQEIREALFDIDCLRFIYVFKNSVTY